MKYPEGQHDREMEIRERLQESFKSIDKIMESPEFQTNTEESWSKVRRLLQEGIDLVGRQEYCKKFDEEFGAGASRHFIKGAETDLE